jgi:thiamine biosynthesis lipoprotein
MADCLSTAMFVCGERRALQYWRDYGGFEMLLITQDGRIVCTQGLYGAFSQSGGDYEVKYVK